jgi:hypothetical protein
MPLGLVVSVSRNPRALGAAFRQSHDIDCSTTMQPQGPGGHSCAAAVNNLPASPGRMRNL